ncbi:hypothetical protein [Streptacidiphilus anmyonensis]|uniref:hypothetical protein n=1 Tax=Streptacidiphilus anmyonensis TaxID=405782 RepID=UPI0005AA4125|nr:hypothetical protein [Streptacidiphilus anmyonensis]
MRSCGCTSLFASALITGGVGVSRDEYPASVRSYGTPHIAHRVAPASVLVVGACGISLLASR